eukprot:UN02241
MLRTKPTKAKQQQRHTKPLAKSKKAHTLQTRAHKVKTNQHNAPINLQGIKKGQFLPDDGKTLKDFFKKETTGGDEAEVPTSYDFISSTPLSHEENRENALGLRSRKYYLETYGCQMNVADSELVHSILHNAGLKHTGQIHDADSYFN